MDMDLLAVETFKHWSIMVKVKVPEVADENMALIVEVDPLTIDIPVPE